MTEIQLSTEKRRITVSLLAQEYCELLNRLFQDCRHDELFSLLLSIRRKQSYLNLDQLLSLPGMSDLTISQIMNFTSEINAQLSMRKRLQLSHHMDVIAIEFLATHSQEMLDMPNAKAS